MHVEDVILLWEPQLLVNTSPVQGGSPWELGSRGKVQKRDMSTFNGCDNLPWKDARARAPCCSRVLLKSITAMQSAREGMCKQAIYPCISSTERCTTQNASRCVISFLAIFPARLLTCQYQSMAFMCNFHYLGTSETMKNQGNSARQEVTSFSTNALHWGLKSRPVASGVWYRN